MFVVTGLSHDWSGKTQLAISRSVRSVRTPTLKPRKCCAMHGWPVWGSCGAASDTSGSGRCGPEAGLAPIALTAAPSTYRPLGPSSEQPRAHQRQTGNLVSGVEH